MYAHRSIAFAVSFLICSGTLTGRAFAAPPNVVHSDVRYNTAMGDNVMSELVTQVNTDENTGAGFSALHKNTTGNSNSAFGAEALTENLTGDVNVAVGTSALSRNTNGYGNTGVGWSALRDNNGYNNSAVGFNALASNKSGYENVAVGALAAYSNTTGVWNTAVGTIALQNTKTGGNNTGTGHAALWANVSGVNNAAFGARALNLSNASENAAVGYGAQYGNTTGNSNAALGYQSLYGNKAGIRNVALGWQAAYAVTGSDNIDLGAANQGTAGENGVIRIGSKAYQKRAFIAGISGVQTGLAAATAVFVDANGQLGTIKSSRQYKADIHPMGNVSERLLALRPVTFHYKQAYDDGSRPIQFGLIAEEVAQTFPELVVPDAKGKPETVRYDLLATLLVNEFQKDHRRIDVLEKQAAELAQLKSQVAVLTKAMQAQRTALVAASH